MQLTFVSPTQINFQVPAGTAPGEAGLVITGDGGSSTAGGMQVDAVARRCSWCPTQTPHPMLSQFESRLTVGKLRCPPATASVLS